MRRSCLLLSILIAHQSATAQSAVNANSPDDALVAKARSIHERVLTIDTHDDISIDFATPKDDPGNHDNPRQVTLQKMREGGLDVGFFIVYVGQGERTAKGNTPNP
jgi:membrane dipeptidase